MSITPWYFGQISTLFSSYIFTCDTHVHSFLVISHPRKCLPLCTTTKVVGLHKFEKLQNFEISEIVRVRLRLLWHNTRPRLQGLFINRFSWMMALLMGKPRSMFSCRMTFCCRAQTLDPVSVGPMGPPCVESFLLETSIKCRELKLFITLKIPILHIGVEAPKASTMRPRS